MKIKSIFFIAIIGLLSACSDEENKDFTAENEAEIQAYITTNELTATRSDTGLYYVIETQGEGEKPTTNSDVTVAYKGYYLDGKIFDQSNADGITFNLQRVIKGWTEGITYFNEGGSGILLVPSHLGYGSGDYNGIPGGSVLAFDITLNKVN